MDYLVFQQINNLAGRGGCLDAAGVFFADYFGYLVAIAAILMFIKKRRAIFQMFLAAIAARFVIVELARFIWERPRPFVENQVNLLLEHADTSSFPSGHAAFFFALSTIIFNYNKKAGVLFFIASLLITISRVFVGIHWPSDILAGAIVGILSGWLIFKFSGK